MITTETESNQPETVDCKLFVIVTTAIECGYNAREKGKTLQQAIEEFKEVFLEKEIQDE